MAKKTNKSQNKLNQSIIILIAVLSIIFWDSPIIYPIKIFIILIHEISHALVTIITGGTVINIKLGFDLSGITITNGGNQVAIAAAGYLGSLFIGSLLYYSAYNQKLKSWLSIFLSITILIIAVNLMEGGIQIFFSLIVALSLFIIPKYLNNKINRYFFNSIGLISCLYIIVDIKQDLLTTSLRETDTQILEYLTGIPALLIGFILFLISVAVVVILIRKSYLFDSNS